jgi:hypothetical protein
MKVSDEFISMLSALPPKDRIELLDSGRRVFLVSIDEYKNLLVAIGQDLDDKKAHGHQDAATSAILEAAINRLPKQMQERIKYFIKNGNPADD